MSLKISTAKLQEMVSRSLKGVGNNKLLPITGLMNISVVDGELILMTTDGTNYLSISDDVGDAEDFYVTVNADQFSKLVLRMTSENITLKLEKNYLLVSGNGQYKIELPLDESGKLIEYPNPFQIMTLTDSEIKSVGAIKLGTVRDILNYIKPALATTLEEPCYTGYYMGDSVVASDSIQIASLMESVFSEPLLISAEMMNMLSVATDENIDVYTNGEKIVFVSDSCSVYGDLMNCIDDFQIDAISGLLSDTYSSQCTLPRSQVLQALDRLSLFVGVYDDNLVKLHFGKSKVTITSKSSDSSEDIEYIGKNKGKEFDCLVDIQMFQTQIRSFRADSVIIFYGEPTALKMVDDEIVKLIALGAE